MSVSPDTVARFQNLATRLLRQARLLDDGSALTSAQYSALSTLYSHPRLPLTELARLERVSHPTASRLVAALARQGLVARDRDDSDGRSTLLSLSESGEAVYKSVYARRLLVIEQVLQKLKPETVADLLTAFESLPGMSGPA